MGNFNLNDYETVKSRKERFYKDHPNGRIIVELMNQDVENHAIFRASIYLSPEDQGLTLPRSTGYAYEIRDRELSVSTSGKQYESINYTSWTENAEESAIGRALDNAGYSGNKKPSREEMEKVQRMSNTISKSVVNKETCEHVNTSKRQSTKESSKGRWFIGCNDCKSFIGWTDAPTSNDLVTNENGSTSFGKTVFSEPH